MVKMSEPRAIAAGAAFAKVLIGSPSNLSKRLSLFLLVLLRLCGNLLISLRPPQTLFSAARIPFGGSTVLYITGLSKQTLLSASSALHQPHTGAQNAAPPNVRKRA